MTSSLYCNLQQLKTTQNIKKKNRILVQIQSSLSFSLGFYGNTAEMAGDSNK